MSFNIGAAGGGAWKIKVSQIECSSLARANPDCNQYFTGNAGSFNSYNWPNVQLQLKRHNICIRKEAGKLRWSNTTINI